MSYIVASEDFYITIHFLHIFPLFKFILNFSFWDWLVNKCFKSQRYGLVWCNTRKSAFVVDRVVIFPLCLLSIYLLLTLSLGCFKFRICEQNCVALKPWIGINSTIEVEQCLAVQTVRICFVYQVSRDHSFSLQCIRWMRLTCIVSSFRCNMRCFIK